MRIDRELTLLRTAVLYADEVQLLSPVTELISRVQKFDGLSRREFLARVGRMNLTEAQGWGIATATSEEWETLSVFLRDPSALEAWTAQIEEQLPTLEASRQHEIRATIQEMRQALEPDRVDALLATMQAQLNEQAETTRYAELGPFLRTNRVRLIPVGAELTGAEMWEQMSDLLTTTAADPRRYLLTDDLTAELVQNLIHQDALKIPSRAASNAREARAHHGLVEAMPTLPDAPLDVVWRVRDELQDSLLRYRSEVFSLSATFGASAYDPAIVDDMEHAWLTTVHPAISEINQALRSSKSLKHYLTTLRDPVGIHAATGGIAHMWFGWIPDIPQLLTGAGSSILLSALSEARSRRQSRRAVGHMPFYFLHQADHRARKLWSQQ